MNPNIHNRWGLLCPSCGQKLINPNQPWPQPCATCGQRTHLKCLNTHAFIWLVDLDIDMDPYKQEPICAKCVAHAANNLTLINQLPQASGTQPQDAYKRFVAQRPAQPKRSVVQLWGPYRVDPDNFVPAVTKVLDIVHNTGPKVRWAVKLGNYQQVPMTNLAAKEIILPNYFDSPYALGRTHQEILDAMTGAAMHEAGHAAYDSAATIIEAQRRIKPGIGQYTWAGATCLNIVCDYNLERKVIERYPAFRHYFTECHRWSVQDSLPNIVKAMQDSGAEDRMDVRLGILVWELLGPGDLEAAGATITPKLKFITQKCFDVLKYAYTKGLLNTEPGKLKTAKALYELVRIVTPVGYQPPPVTIPPPPPGQGQQPQPPGGCQIGGFPGQQGEPQESDDESETEEDAEGTPSDTPGRSGRPRREATEPESTVHPDTDGDDRTDSGTDSQDVPGDGDQEEESPAGDSEAQSDQEPGGEDPDGDGTGTDSGDDGDDDGDTESDIDDGSLTGSGSDTQGDSQEESSQGQGSEDNDDGSWVGNSVYDDPGIADNTGDESEEPGGSSVDTPSVMGGKSGSEQEVKPENDPFTGAGSLEDDPSRRKNSKKDALDDLSEENANEEKLDPIQETQNTSFTQDQMFDPRHRDTSDKASHPPAAQHMDGPEAYQMPNLEKYHSNRVQELAPVISRLKKVLRFRNADWGGRQTGRRSGTLTRRHVSRLSAFGSDKVFHKTKPDETPKVRIALLIDESESMNGGGLVAPYIAAKNAATALTQALHGIRGVKLWSWGFSLNRNYNYTGPSSSQAHRTLPTLRAYVDPIRPINPAVIEVSPMNGGTPTGEAMDFAAETINKNSSPDEKKIVFIITDGEAGGYVSTESVVRKWTGKVTFVHIGIGHTVDTAIPYYIGPVTNIELLPDLLSESVTDILT